MKKKSTTKAPKQPKFELNEAKLTLFHPRTRHRLCWFAREEKRE